MLLAGDLGGTKTLLGLYERAAPRPRPIGVREFATLEHAGLPAMVETFLGEARASPASIDATVVGVAGPVREQEAELTNVPWRVSARALSAHLGLRTVFLLNDVEAMGYAVETLEPQERVVLREGSGRREGNAVLLTVGTGIGQAILHRVSGRFVPVPSEGGHADFPARTEREIALLRALRLRFGRVDVERVASGPGLAHVARVVHPGACPQFPADVVQADEPALVTGAALDGRCAACREALEIYVEALGAIAGNLALTAVATGGVFIGGGVPPKILPALRTGTFLAAFDAKPPLDDLLRSMPVTVIALPQAGLVGAAVHAATLA